MQSAVLKSALKRQLGRRYNEDVWGLLELDGYVSEVVELGADPQTLYERAKLLLDYLRPQKVRTTPEPTPTAAPSSTPARERAAVLSDLVAEVARQDPDVLRFRTKHLSSGLIPWVDLENWLKDNGKNDPKTIEVKVAIRMDDDSKHPSHATDLIPMLGNARITSWEVRTLDYAIPSNRWVRRMAVSTGSKLDSLRILSESLSKSYGWEPAQATVFVVTDTIAYTEPIRATGPSEQIRNGTDIGWARRIKLDIDPTLTPDEVAATYQKIREANGLNRLRPIGTKHLRLASFTGSDHVTLSWPNRFDLWNRLYPAWQYSAASNFRRDAIRAQYRILYPGRHRGSAPIRDEA